MILTSAERSSIKSTFYVTCCDHVNLTDQTKNFDPVERLYAYSYDQILLILTNRRTFVRQVLDINDML